MNDVIFMLRKTRESIKSSGKLVAILPSFDTTIYLKDLWLEHYSSVESNIRIDSVERAFNMAKRVNHNTLSYADDGNNNQCYHTPDSINEEFSKAGLKIIGTPQKVYYPWILTRRFGYGYFPEAKEEIWDWFVVAERSSIK